MPEYELELWDVVIGTICEVSQTEECECELADYEDCKAKKEVEGVEHNGIFMTIECANDCIMNR